MKRVYNYIYNYRAEIVFVSSLLLLIYWVDLDIDAFIQIFGFFYNIFTHTFNWIQI